MLTLPNNCAQGVRCINFIVPAEKGIKASLRRKWPSESKKCSGLKMSGVSHSFLSCSTEEKFVIIMVPYK